MTWLSLYTALLYGYVARPRPRMDPAHRILSCGDSRGRPQTSCLHQVVLSEGYGHGGPGVCLGDGQTEAYLKDTGMPGLASAWGMARRRSI